MTGAGEINEISERNNNLKSFCDAFKLSGFRYDWIGLCGFV